MLLGRRSHNRQLYLEGWRRSQRGEREPPSAGHAVRQQLGAAQRRGAPCGGQRRGCDHHPGTFMTAYRLPGSL